MGIGWIYVLVAYLAITLVVFVSYRIEVKKDGENKSALKSLGESSISILFFFVIMASVWVPFLESLDTPGSCRTESYSAKASPVPEVPESTPKDRYKQVLTTQHEETVGSKEICKTLLFAKKRGKVIVEAKSAKYSLKTIENPDYIPPKSAPIYTPPAQEEYRCPVTTCCDGTCSWSRGRGTCSWHGGVCGY